ERRIVVIADPHPDHQIIGIAHEQRVAIVLRGAGLAEIRSGQHRRAARALIGLHRFFRCRR
ncbi:hypothetical protein LCGC14_2173480, partial [marine sediment metagenome]